MVPCIAEPPLEDVRREALLIARSLPPGLPRASAVISLLLAPGAAGLRAGLDEALETAREIDDKSDRSWMLVRVAAVLDRETRDAVAHEALAVARSISEDERYFKPSGIDQRARLLMAVLPVLEAPERRRSARELFEVVRAMPDDRWRTLAFKDLVPYLDADQRRDLVQDARRTAVKTTDFMARSEAL